MCISDRLRCLDRGTPAYSESPSGALGTPALRQPPLPVPPLGSVCTPALRDRVLVYTPADQSTHRNTPAAGNHTCVRAVMYTPVMKIGQPVDDTSSKSCHTLALLHPCVFMP
jgi:hypothetical protein